MAYIPAGTYNDAALSPSDKSRVENYKADYDYYSSWGTPEGDALAAKAHEGAEMVRAAYGYSGGGDGSDYIPLTTAGNSVTSAAGDTSGSGWGNNNKTNYEPAGSPSYPFNYSSYDDFYNKNGYSGMSAAQQAAVDTYVQMMTENINLQKKAANEQADEQARQAYIQYMKSKNTLPQTLSATGYSGGLADSQLIGLESGLQNNQNAISRERANALLSLDNAINQARLQGEQQKLSERAALMQSAIGAYNNYTGQANQYANSDYWNRYNADNSNYWNQYNANNSNYWNNLNFDYQKERDAVSDSRQTAQQSLTLTMALLDMGVMPSAEMLLEAGIGELEAQAYVKAVKAARR